MNFCHRSMGPKELFSPNTNFFEELEETMEVQVETKYKIVAK